MTSIQQRVLVLVSISLILFLGLLFWPFVYNQMIFPISKLIWILLRIFVLSIDQKYIWGGLIFGIIFLLFRKIGKQLPQVDIAEDFTTPHETYKDIDYWGSIFNLMDFEDDQIKSELVHLLVKVYASGHGNKPDYRVTDEFSNGQIALPQNIKEFLFPDKPVREKNLLRKLQRAIKQAVQSGLFQSKRRRKEIFFQNVCEVLSFMEISMENNDDAQ